MNKYLVKKIEEDIDFGCEERFGEQEAMVLLTLVNERNEETVIKIEDQYLYDQDINEKDHVFCNEDGNWQKWIEHTEYFDVCDDDGQPTGQIVSRKTAHEKGIHHRTAHIWVIRRSGCQVDVLLQKRSLLKDSFPGCLDTSSAGHIRAGDEPLESALRELEEELGISAKKEDLHDIGAFSVDYREVFHGKTFADRETANVFVYEKPVDIDKLIIQKEELESVGWYDFHETIKKCEEDDPAYCCPTGGLKKVKEYLLSACVEKMHESDPMR